MQLHELSPKFKRRAEKRVGRGGKRGTYSGRGQKGQKARAGHRIRPAERDTISRLPKLRGVKNPPKRRVQKTEITLTDLQNLGEETIGKEVLKKHGIIKSVLEDVKVLCTGSISRAVTLRGIAVSASAKKKIEAAGGSIV